MGTTLIPQDRFEQLLENGRRQEEAKQNGEAWVDFAPVVKLFAPDGMATWLLAFVYPADPDVAFGLCDLGLGDPALGEVRLSWLVAYPGPAGLSVKHDPDFSPEKTITQYAAEARKTGYAIVCVG